MNTFQKSGLNVANQQIVNILAGTVGYQSIHALSLLTSSCFFLTTPFVNRGTASTPTRSYRGTKPTCSMGEHHPHECELFRQLRGRLRRRNSTTGRRVHGCPEYHLRLQHRQHGGCGGGRFFCIWSRQVGNAEDREGKNVPALKVEHP